MAATSAVPFQWGAQGRKITTPEQAAKQRLVAEALMLSGKSPAANWAQGLGDVTGALTGSILNNEVSAAEEAGALEASGLFQGLGSSSPEADIIAALSSPWANDNQSAVARAILNSQLEQNDPMYQVKLAQLQAGDTGSPETYFGTPLYTEDANGNLIANQLGNQGTFNPIELPEGQTLAPPTKEVDTGTEIITFDRFGNELFRTPKQNVLEAQQAAVGTGLGKAQVEVIDAGRAARSNNAKLDILEQTLSAAPQGLQGALVQAAGKMGIAVEGLDDVQAANAIISQLVPLQRLPGSGTMSDADLALFRDSLPAIMNQPGGNKKIIRTLRAINDYVEKAGDIEYRVATGKITQEEADAEYGSLADPLENFNSASGSKPNPNAVVIDGFTIEAE
jgi:hypothetical protein